MYYYLDDVIYSESFEEHLEHIRVMIDRLRHAGLTLRHQKVDLATQQISFFEHLVSPGFVRIDPECTRPIKKFPIPQDNKGLARFIAMLNFYLKFIPGLADVCASLNALREKRMRFVWGQEQQEAFESLKRALSQHPVLGMAKFPEKFVLQTDTSGAGLRVVLSQEHNRVR